LRQTRSLARIFDDHVDICIRNARLRRGADDLVDIAVAGGRIVALGHALSVTGLDEIDAGGIDVALGQDDISDAYYPFGRNDMLEVAFLVPHLLWMTARTEIETLYDTITVTPARAINITNFDLAVGAAREHRRARPGGRRRGVTLPRGATLRCQSRTPR
jgi:hypothetical protein